MRVLILHLAMALGGGERTTSNLVRYRDPAVVRHLTLAAPGFLQDYFPASYERFIDTTDYGLGYGFSDWRGLYRDSRNCGRLLQEAAPDIAMGMMHYPSALVVLGKRLARLRMQTIASFRGPFYEYMRFYESQRLRRLFLRASVSLSACLADKVIVPSQGTADEVRHRFFGSSRKNLVIPNGIDYSAAVQSAQQPPAETITSRPGEFLLCAAARLASEKNLPLLLQAFQRLSMRALPVRLLIVGDGPEREELQRLVMTTGLSDKVNFVGYQSNVFPYMQRADVFIHTCLFEGFGYAMLEAMACATAVIATDCPFGPREILGDSEYGLLVPPNDPDALAAAIERLLSDPSLRWQLAAKGLQRARELSIERMVRSYEQTFQKMSKSPIV